MFTLNAASIIKGITGWFFNTVLVNLISLAVCSACSSVLVALCVPCGLLDSTLLRCHGIVSVALVALLSWTRSCYHHPDLTLPHMAMHTWQPGKGQTHNSVNSYTALHYRERHAEWFDLNGWFGGIIIAKRAANAAWLLLIDKNVLQLTLAYSSILRPLLEITLTWWKRDPELCSEVV